ncbi:bacteriocin immunity protein [Aliivibrio fischeri]|uniref:Bacteriocin immunity protein n=1 Tax=Aliivibrio fischeri TaxID=668 RepID=A0A510UD05_ALIFS|nr:bacteriocin immunity protein [Aliivibrio fischeri]GEK12474.1 bacteriocin immunity protein [Aliivibrio fischeri]
MSLFEIKKSLNDYTEDEFKELMQEFFDNKHNLSGDGFAIHIQELSDYFIRLTEHPYGNGVIFNPKEEQDDSPEGIVLEVKKWRESQGLPCFKDQ